MICTDVESFVLTAKQHNVNIFRQDSNRRLLFQIKVSHTVISK